MYGACKVQHQPLTAWPLPKLFATHSQDPQIQSDRYSRHGWGDTSLLKEEGYAGIQHPRGQTQPEGGKARMQSPRGSDGRNGASIIW